MRIESPPSHLIHSLLEWDDSREVGESRSYSFDSPHIPRDTPQKTSFEQRFSAFFGVFSLYAAKWSVAKNVGISTKIGKIK